MAAPVSAQLQTIAAVLLAGLALGALYDALAVLRGSAGTVIGIGADVLFCLCFAAALFLLGMGPGGGTLRLYMPPLTLGGMALWHALFAPAWKRRCGRVLAALHTACARLGVPLRRAAGFAAKKFSEICKKMVYNNKRKVYNNKKEQRLGQYRVRQGVSG